jgi:hypothetical protein
VLYKQLFLHTRYKGIYTFPGALFQAKQRSRKPVAAEDKIGSPPAEVLRIVRVLFWGIEGNVLHIKFLCLVLLALQLT